MTDEIMNLRTLLEKSSDADLLREMIGFTAQRLMELEVEGLTGAARASLGQYLDFYNSRRPHSSLDGMTPDQAYFPPLPLRLAA